MWFERSAHLPNTEEADAFNAFMIETVRPAIEKRALEAGARRAVALV